MPAPTWGGTGAAELPASDRGVVIDEVLSNPFSSDASGDQIELYNSTNTPIDVAGWYLSDSTGTPQKYRINSVNGTINTVIPAHGFLVLTELENFGNPGNPGTMIPFGFSRSGEKAVLSSATAEGLTGYQDTESFGAAAPGSPSDAT